AVAGDDVGDAKRPQPFDGIGNDSLHDPAEVQPAHDAVDRNVGKEIASMETYIDDARVRARAEYDQSQVAHVRHHHALIHEQRIGFPGRVGTRSREMVDAAFLERRDPRYLPAVIEMAVEQQPSIRIIDHLRAALLQFARAWNVGDRHHHAALEPDGAFVEHAGIDVDGDATAVFHDGLH